MRRGLLLLVTVAIGAIVLAACVPPPPAPAPAPTTAAKQTTTTKAPVTTTSSTTTTSTTTTTTRPPVSGAWAQNGPLGSCRVFPADNPWNRDVSALPVDANSANYLATIAALGGNQKLHADFGGAGEYGIPYITVPGTQTPVGVDFTAYGDESDPGPYPIPLAAPVEGGSDAHVLAVDRDRCKLYELFAAIQGHEPLVGRLRRGVRPHVERAASRGLDVGRRRRAADLRRARALRRGGERAHRPRAALHRLAFAEGVPPPGDALRVVVHRPEPPADGPASAAEGELQRVVVHRPGACRARTR